MKLWKSSCTIGLLLSPLMISLLFNINPDQTETFLGSNWAELPLIHLAAIFWIKKVFGSHKKKKV